MVTPLLIMVGAAGGLILLLLLIFRRDAVALDLSGRTLLRLYLFLASLASVIVFAIGVSLVLDWTVARVAGPEVVYGRPPTVVICPVAEKCPDPAQLAAQRTHEIEQRQDQDLIAGITLTVFGALFWAGHRFARRAVAGPDDRTSSLRRAYVTLGTFVFGLAVIVLLPVGVYQALSAAVLHPGPDVYKPGVGGSLSGGLVALPIWLWYLVPLARDFRAPPKPVVASAPLGA